MPLRHAVDKQGVAGFAGIFLRTGLLRFVSIDDGGLRTAKDGVSDGD